MSPLRSRLTEFADRRVWDLGGHPVTRLLIDFRFSFECWWREDGIDTLLRVVIEAPFILRIGDQELRCAPAEGVQSVAPALAILHKPVASLTAHRDGRLHVAFGDGADLKVGKRPRYESWEASGTGELADLQLLCSPHEGPPWGT